MNRTQKQLESVATLLRQQTTLSLATTDQKGEPCVAPLFYIADEELVLYWLSSERSLHSRNLLANPRVAATVHSNAQSWREIRGLQINGLASKVIAPERRAPLIKNYSERFKLGTLFRVAIQQSALYALEPDSFRLIDHACSFSSKFELTRTPHGWTLTRPPR
ncbi:MAG: pyridoxamine 5'-phosphate oxidase family protein [Terracidiphilus sp.]